MFREIVVWPDPMLSRKCEEVTTFDATLSSLLIDMEDTMLAAGGAGLAAPQVGFALRAVVVLVKKPDGTREVLKLVNPKVVETRGPAVESPEGCLSLPGYFAPVRRPAWVRVEAVDEYGSKVEVEGDGLLARALCHELEHLDGRVFVERLTPFKREVVRKMFRKAKAAGLGYRSVSPTSLLEKPTP